MRLIKRRIDKIILAGGVVNTLLGYAIATTPKWCDAHWPFCWDWSAYNVPLGVVVALIGLIMLATAFRKGQRDYKEVFICPGCETARPYAEVTDKTCPRCGAPMEPLKGFYERHPERKERG